MPAADHPPASAWEALDPEVTRHLRARRQLLLQGPLDGERATRLTAELMTLEAEALDAVTVIINSAGGDLGSLFAVTDTISVMHAPVATRALGQARGPAAALVAAGTGTRRAGRHAQLVLELPDADVSGSALDLDRAARAETGLTDQLVDLMTGATGRPRQQVAAEWRRGRVLSAHEALAQGLVDEVDEPAVRGD